MRSTKSLITSEHAKTRLVYSMSTGLFTWLAVPEKDRFNAAWNTRWAGVVAGSPTPRGYVEIAITVNDEKHKVMAHNLAWLYVTGAWPVDLVDHRDTDRVNNRWANLRLANHSQNSMNQRVRINNTSGHKGVFWDGVNKKWRVIVMVDGKSYCCGRYVNIEDAVKARAVGAERLHGEFARER